MVVYGGCVYNGVIQGISFIKDNRQMLRDSHLFVFAVGLTSNGDNAAFEQVLARNFKQEEREGIQFYHFMGALDHKKLSILQKPMMYILKKNIQSKRPEARNQVEQYLLDSYGGKIDFTNRAYVEPMVRTIQETAVDAQC